MKTYKVTYNLKCRDFQYEIGKKHVHEGELIPCKQGFHSCPELKDVFNYYYYPRKDIKVFECEIEGEEGTSWIKDEDKMCSNNIKLIEEADLSGILKIDGNRFELFNGRVWEYDSNGNLIYSKDSNEFEEWFEYDSNGNLIYSKDSNGYEWRK